MRQPSELSPSGGDQGAGPSRRPVRSLSVLMGTPASASSRASLVLLSTLGTDTTPARLSSMASTRQSRIPELVNNCDALRASIAAFDMKKETEESHLGGRHEDDGSCFGCHGGIGWCCRSSRGHAGCEEVLHRAKSFREVRP